MRKVDASNRNDKLKLRDRRCGLQDIRTRLSGCSPAQRKRTSNRKSLCHWTPPDPGDHIVGFYVRNGQPHTLGLNSDEVLSTFTHSGILVLPGLGPTLMAGPLVDVMTRVIDTLHETHTTGGTSLVGAGLRSLGVATDRLLHFDNVLNAGEVLILVDTLDTERLAQVTALLEQCEISLMDS